MPESVAGAVVPDFLVAIPISYRSISSAGTGLRVGEVTVEVDAGLAVITIDRPHARNAIGLATIDDLGRALDELEQAAVEVLVIRGGGDRAFVSGGDLKELSAIRDEDGAIAMATSMRRLLDRVATFPAPVIAAMNGHALGGGAEVAVAADLRVAADDIKVGFTQVRLGIMPAWGGAERLAEIVGRSRALLLIARGTTLTAGEAEALGLVDVVAPRAEFDAAWRELAQTFVDLPPGTGRSVKDVLAAAHPSHHPTLEGPAVRHFARLWVGDAHWAAAERPRPARNPTEA
ncbi:enoyl-CoA hydratase/isomerase family protein [Baekduia soli]|uniref:Enoyl-CoA hydratase/isomerase family protein n=1 Tax=Baekduia soli TaxID=496014 RepID=A0A5B8U0M1_9ACTN|nr:enoyl-CoA hydratase/isomerase family protein [Baekduia soli]QEC46528.1 enoyl-CoA hydratase/isomerase family protein [Baekduia soli]